jgi:tail length tape measure protein
MPVSAGVVYVDIAPQVAKTFGSDIEKQVTGPVEDSGKRVGGSLTKVAGLIGSAFAAKGIFDFGRNAIEAATESNKIAAQTEAVIKSTGGAAKVTADQIGELATSISNKTGVDDEAIQSASNLLLTFTNLKNGVGKSNDVFNQATKIAVDMGAALGGDASSNAIQLGKALNDPVKGIAALTRVGVTFTDQQKEQIKSMVAAGDTMGAQKVILGELNKEFGGSAEAQATAGDRLKVVWGNVQEQIGNVLLPIFEKVATFLADNLPGAIKFFGDAFNKIKPIVQGVIDAFGVGGLGGALSVVGNLGHRHRPPRHRRRGTPTRQSVVAMDPRRHPTRPSSPRRTPCGAREMAVGDGPAPPGREARRARQGAVAVDPGRHPADAGAARRLVGPAREMDRHRRDPETGRVHGRHGRQTDRLDRRRRPAAPRQARRVHGQVRGLDHHRRDPEGC